MRRRRWAMLAGAVLLAGSAGCGIPSDDSAEALPGGVVVPSVDPATPAPPASERGNQAVEQAGIFLVSSDRLVAVPRTVPAPQLGPVLRALLEGPTRDELSAGFRTAITPGTRLREASVTDATAVIDLTADFVEVGGGEQILSVGQIVLTATGVPGVERVRFALDGAAVDVPRADGTLTTGPLTAADFDSLRAGNEPPP